MNPDLVARDREGRANTVRYEAVNAMLLNEFLKEHRKMHSWRRPSPGSRRTSKLSARASKNRPCKSRR